MWVGFALGDQQVGFVCISNMSVEDCDALTDKIIPSTEDYYGSKSDFKLVLQDLVRREQKKRNEIDELFECHYKALGETPGCSEPSRAKTTFHKTTLENYLQMKKRSSNARIRDKAAKRSSEEKSLLEFFRTMFSRATRFFANLALCRQNM